MTFLTSLALLTFTLPQGEPAPASAQSGTDKPALLSASEQSNLREKLRAYIAAEVNYKLANSAKDRQKASKIKEDASDKFDTEWKKYEKKGNLVASITDMRAVFENCFVVKRPPFTGQLRELSVKEDQISYSVYVPKTYKETDPTRTVIVLPSATAVEGGNWVKPVNYFAATWDKTTALNNTIFQFCHGTQGVEFDPVPDYSREGAQDEEEARHRNIFIGLREVLGAFNVDRARIFLEGGRGSSAFAVRFATMFPHRFAGIVLRYPTPVDDIRLGSLHGLPILMLRHADTQKDFAAIEAQLKAAAPGMVEVLDVTDEFPHHEAAAKIEEWMQKQRRNMTPSKVIIEPNHDRFNNCYWADIDTADLLATSPPDKKVRLEVEADRATNRIVVKTVGVERFRLYLNDSLIDLDKEFTVVVNDKAVSETRQRSFPDMLARVSGRNDWDCLFPVEYVTTVAK